MWNKGWDTIFSEHDWGKYPPEEVVRFISRAYGKIPDKSCVTVLEIGCGPGANIWYLAREGYRVFGIDGSKIAIAQARNRLSRESLSAELLIGDALKLSYDNDMFDCVLDIECLYANTLGDAKKIVREVKRVLKPNGLFFF